MIKTMLLNFFNFKKSEKIKKEELEIVKVVEPTINNDFVIKTEPKKKGRKPKFKSETK